MCFQLCLCFSFSWKIADCGCVQEPPQDYNVTTQRPDLICRLLNCSGGVAVLRDLCCAAAYQDGRPALSTSDFCPLTAGGLFVCLFSLSVILIAFRRRYFPVDVDNGVTAADSEVARVSQRFCGFRGTSAGQTSSRADQQVKDTQRRVRFRFTALILIT